MLRTETKQIGEHTYKVQQLDAVKGRAVFLRLGQAIAPALENGGNALAAAKDGDVDYDRIFGAIAKVITNIKPEDLEYFCAMFAPTTDVVIVNPETGKTREPKLSTIMSLHFAGDELVHLFEWLFFCFEVNFGAFFAKLGVLRATSGARTTESK